MNFIEGCNNRWVCGSFIIAQYPQGFFAYQYFKYRSGGRDSKRLHKKDEPLLSLDAAKDLITAVALQPIPDGIVLINAPGMDKQETS